MNKEDQRRSKENEEKRSLTKIEQGCQGPLNSLDLEILIHLSNGLKEFFPLIFASAGRCSHTPRPKILFAFSPTLQTQR